jgi:AraC-like DNA-binding protein
MKPYLYKVNDAFLANSKFILYTPQPLAKKLPFQVFACGHFFATGNYEVEREGVGHFLLAITLSGKGELHYDNQYFSLDKGRIFLIDCERYHHYKTALDQWELMWVRFDCTQGIDYLQLLNGDSFEAPLFENILPFEKNLSKIITLAQSHEPYADLSLSHLVSALLTEYGIQKHQQSTLSMPITAKKIVFEIIAFFEEHYDTEINIEELAQDYHINKYSFIRLFKKQTGLTPYEFLQNIRITSAKFLLEQSDYSINEISGRVGFNDQNNFIREFKLTVGTTPLRYRNRFRGSSLPNRPAKHLGWNKK